MSVQNALEESEDAQTSILPEFRFSSSSHGRNIILSEDGLEAHRVNTHAKYGDGVYIDTPLRGRFELEVKITDSNTSQHHGSLEIGICQYPRGSYRHVDIPHKLKKSRFGCIQWLNDTATVLNHFGFGLYRSADLKLGDTIGFELLENGNLYFFVNGIDQGLAGENLYSEDKDIYAVVYIRGRCTAVRITKSGQTQIRS